nr:Chain E, Regulator of nonsense transcripts 1 [Homo sapiens]
QPELSQDSYLG